MDEGIRRIFRRHMRRKAEAAKNISGINFKSFDSVAAYVMYELTELYSEICGISYDTAAAQLREGDDDDEG